MDKSLYPSWRSASFGPLHREKGKLTNGELAFSTIDVGQGPVVLCLHGFPDNRHTYQHQIQALVEAGFRVIAPSLRGYEPESQPQDNDYRLASLVGDVIAWIDQIDEDKVHLVGHDWGAVISYCTAAVIPERLYSLTAMSVPPLHGISRAFKKHPRQLLSSWYMFFFQLRGFSDWVFEQRDWQLIRMLWQSWSPSWDIPASTLDSVKQSFSQPGVKAAALNYYRQIVSTDMLLGRETELRRYMSRVQIPTLAITGANDRCIQQAFFQEATRTKRFPNGIQAEVIEAAGHFPHQQRPELVNPLIVNWLKKHTFHKPGLRRAAPDIR